jgi:hypothetical protein
MMLRTVTLRRSVVKAITYRIVIVCLDFLTVYLFTGAVRVALGFMIVSNIYTTFCMKEPGTEFIGELRKHKKNFSISSVLSLLSFFHYFRSTGKKLVGTAINYQES